MPDRDQFAHVPRGIRTVVEALTQACTGGFADPLLIADAITKLLEGGVATLGPVFAVLDSINSGDQKLLPLAIGAALDDIAKIRLTHGRSATDLVLERVANAAIIDGTMDRHAVAHSFVDELLRHAVVESTKGVVDRLKRPLTEEEQVRLGAALAPVVEAAAREVAERPDFNRLRFGWQFRTELDAHTNILRGLK